MQELVSSVKVLAGPGSVGMHARWAAEARRRVVGLRLDMLRALVRDPGYLPDFLFPPPTGPDTHLDAEVDRVRATTASMVRAELDRMRGVAPALRRLYDDPERALGGLVDELRAYWRAAVEPVWPRLRGLLDADLQYRAGQLTSGGVEQMLSGLHPRLEYSDEALRIRLRRWNSTSDLRGAGLVLIPCAFAWPGLVVTKDTRQPMLTYAPRGIGVVWSGTSDVARPLAQLLGRSRAALLARLDLPLSTTELAVYVGLNAPAVSEHLSVLRRAGLVTARRCGRSVLYQRTALATDLLGRA